MVDTSLINPAQFQLTADISPLTQQLMQALGQRSRQQQQTQAKNKKAQAVALKEDMSRTALHANRIRDISDPITKRAEIGRMAQEEFNKDDGDPGIWQELLTETDTDKINVGLIRIFTATGNAEKLISQSLKQETDSEKFEPIEDEAGNVIAQKNLTTGQVITDPRAAFTKEKLKAGKIAAAEYKDVETVGGKKFGINKSTGTYEQIPLGQHARLALQEQETAKKEAKDAKKLAETQKTAFNQTQSLRKEFESKTKPQQQAMDAFRSFQSLQEADKELLDNFKSNFGVFAAKGIDKKKILNDSQAISDIALIFSFFKTVDPASTVREGEFATIENAGGVDTRFRNMYTRLLEGGRLNKAQRSQIVRIAQNKSKSAQKEIDRQSKRFSFSAKKQGIDPDLVIVPEVITKEKINTDEASELEALKLELGL